MSCDHIELNELFRLRRNRVAVAVEDVLVDDRVATAPSEERREEREREERQDDVRDAEDNADVITIEPTTARTRESVS